MKVSLNWLRELVEIPATVPELVDLLTLAGVEVEDVIQSALRSRMWWSRRSRNPCSTRTRIG